MNLPIREEVLPMLHRRVHATLVEPPPKLPRHGTTFYLSIQFLIPGQEWISVDNIIGKIKKAHTETTFVKNKHGEIDIAFADGTSAEPMTDQPKIKVAATEAGYIIIDGHHETCRAVLLGSKTVPVEVVEDFTKRHPKMAMEAVWSELKSKHLSLFSEAKTPKHLAQFPPCLCDLSDKPNRFLARLLGMKVLTDEQGKVTLAETRGVKHPIWVKVNRGIPFIEFYIADILEKNSIHYDIRWGEDVPKDIVEEARHALVIAQANGPHKDIINGIHLLKSKDKADEFLDKKNWDKVEEKIRDLNPDVPRPHQSHKKD